MEEVPKPNQTRIISFEAAIALIVALINLALDQADIHVMIVSWISVLACIALGIDVLRRTTWAAHPRYGKRRLTLGSTAILIAFLSFGIFLSVHKKIVPGDTPKTRTETARITEPPKPAPEPKNELPPTVEVKKPAAPRKRSLPMAQSETPPQPQPKPSEPPASMQPASPIVVAPGGAVSFGQQGGVTVAGKLTSLGPIRGRSM